MTGSSNVTGNDSLDGVDPGGTRPTSAGKRGKPAPKSEQHVQSGDRNTVRDGTGTAQDDEARNPKGAT